MSIHYVKHHKIDLKNHSELNEKWVQDIIAKDPAIIGLGDLLLKDKERIQPRAGRLDILLQDTNASKRFEVEIQLGKTDENHIIRTIEYWDIERKRFPQYEHFAVLIAEDITSRFLNVISLFNGFIPLIAIQMNAIKIGDNMSLVFTKVLDQLKLGLVDEDEDVAEKTDRNYWEQKGTKQTMTMADEILGLIKTIDSNFEFNYVKHYIGLINEGQINNFVKMVPQKNNILITIRIPKSDEIDEKIDTAGLDTLDYDEKWNRYRIRIKKDEIEKKKEIIIELLKISYNYSI
jgi:predicted transport protein